MSTAAATLTPHAASQANVIRKITVELNRTDPKRLHLRYLLEGDIARLFVSRDDEPIRTDELWRRTCCEVFLRAETGERYYEYNLAPSTRWAAYRFNGYRNEMADVEVATPVISTEVEDWRFVLSADLDMDQLPHLPGDASWLVSLSVVVEDLDGNVAWWALTHPSEAADFHNRASFVMTLPEAGASA